MTITDKSFDEFCNIYIKIIDKFKQINKFDYILNENNYFTLNPYTKYILKNFDDCEKKKI